MLQFRVAGALLSKTMLRLMLLVVGLCLLNCAAAGKVCARPRQIPDSVFRPGKVLYEPRDIVTYSCIPGYIKDSGNDKAVCSTLGNWELATLKCKLTQCPKPGPLDNGKIHYRDLKYQSLVSFSCNEGYRLNGANESKCTETGTWSGKLPICEQVTCPHPTIPKFGQLDLYRPREGNVSIYLDVAGFSCQQNYALFGNENATCRENGTWSQIPECKDVKCQRPTEILNGYMSFAPSRKYYYKEVVTYGCNPQYTLEGPRISYCDKDEQWTQKPFCRAPCHVSTPKATVLLNGRKTRVDEISGQQIQHGDTLAYYCKNKIDKCAYTVESQCRDGNFTVPACYKQPGYFSLFSTDPSKMTPCAQDS